MHIFNLHSNLNCLLLDHSCKIYCNLIGQEEVANSDRYLHDSDRHLRVFDTHAPTTSYLWAEISFSKCIVYMTVYMYDMLRSSTTVTKVCIGYCLLAQS